MNKKFLIIPIIIAIIAMVVIGSQSNSTVEKTDTVFHVTLASPDLYENGIYTKSFVVEKGEYQFRFVPNGDSPKKLSISLHGPDLKFSENFILNGTLHDTGISEYYTWDYDGQKFVNIPSRADLSIVINPNGNMGGSVSVDIIRK